MKKEIDLAVTNYGCTKDLTYDMAILPWGATEPHNLHLPYLTDCLLAHGVAVDAAELALSKYQTRAMVLPYVGFGSQNLGQHELKFCIHASYETQRAILGDIVASLYKQGLRRLLIINGHGGNSFKNMIRDLAVDYPDFLIACSDWFTVVPASDYFVDPGDHAGELETAAMMHYYPELVNLEEAGSGATHPFAIATLREKVAWLPRNWSKVSEDTGVGNPQHATAENGKRFAQAVAEKYAQFIYEFSKRELY